MEATGITILSQLITDARSRFGAFNVRVIEIAPSLLDEVMDHVLTLGGQVGLDSCVVEGVEVRELPETEQTPRVLLVDEDEPRSLVALAED